jgi:hypothetical protein
MDTGAGSRLFDSMPDLEWAIFVAGAGRKP